MRTWAREGALARSEIVMLAEESRSALLDSPLQRGISIARLARTTALLVHGWADIELSDQFRLASIWSRCSETQAP